MSAANVRIGFRHLADDEATPCVVCSKPNKSQGVWVDRGRVVTTHYCARGHASPQPVPSGSDAS